MNEESILADAQNKNLAGNKKGLLCEGLCINEQSINDVRSVLRDRDTRRLQLKR